MKKKRRTNLILVFACCVLMFAWIGIALMLTGGRDFKDFSAKDWGIFKGFIAVELLTVGLTFYFANRAGKMNAALGGVPPQPKLDSIEKKQRRVMTALFILGAAISYSAELFGILRLRQAEETWRPMLLCMGLLFASALINPILANRYLHALSRRQEQEGDSFLFVKKADAVGMREEKLSLLRRLRVCAGIYAATLFLIALVGSFFAGGLHKIERVIWLWWPFGFFAGAAMERYPLVIWGSFDTQYNSLECKNFPKLWSLCERAAQAVGCRDTLKLCTIGNSDITVFGKGGECMVSLGIDALLTLTEDEVYQTLLRAFAPSADKRARRENRYAYWLQGVRDTHALAPLCAIAFRLPDTVYQFQYQLFCYASGLCEWETTAAAIEDHADPKVAASSLLRAQYYELWNWEQENRDFPQRNTYEELLHDLRYIMPENFRRDLSSRKAFWDKQIENELVPEDWPDRTLMEKIKSFGIEKPELLPYAVSPEYRDEVLRATEKVDDADAREAYENENRAAQKNLDEWEAEGRPLRPQDYGGILNSLRTRGRISDALALCQRAIDELPDGVSVDYPFCFQGCKLLHEWDERGLRYVYRAMEGNGNYIEDGLKTISFFCRYSGNKEAMRQYEERAQELQRRHEEEDAEIGVLRRTDELSAETPPMSLKESILKEILSIDHGEIKRIFLVRKRITPTRSTSAMVVQLDPNTSEARREEIMQRIFNLLDDSTSWQFSLFDYEAVRPVGVERIEGSVFYEKEKNDE